MTFSGNCLLGMNRRSLLKDRKPLSYIYCIKIYADQKLQYEEQLWRPGHECTFTFTMEFSTLRVLSLSYHNHIECQPIITRSTVMLPQ